MQDKFFKNNTGTSNNTLTKISSIILPNKTSIQFLYGPHLYMNNYNIYNQQNDQQNDGTLSMIQIKDTALRLGFKFDYKDSAITPNIYKPLASIVEQTRVLLTAVTPFTKYEKQKAYQFEYYTPTYPKNAATRLNSGNDHWGFPNEKINTDTTNIPNVNGYNWGADRSVDFNFAVGDALKKFILPTGGYVQYFYESNDRAPIENEPQELNFNPQNFTNESIKLQQVNNNLHRLSIYLDPTISRLGTTPATGNLQINILNTAGSTNLITKTISLQDLFYTGFKTIEFNLDNGNYQFQAFLQSGSSVYGPFFIKMYWDNKVMDNNSIKKESGGIRVFQIAKYNIPNVPNSNTMPAVNFIESYRYIDEQGRSSGFLGDVPTYTYKFLKTYTNNNNVNSFTVVHGEPVAPMDYAAGATIGYARVEIYKNYSDVPFFNANVKEVIEYTTLKDINSNTFQMCFPFKPNEIKQWGLGLTKRISIYDSVGALIKRTSNNYNYDNTLLNNDNFKSLTLGHQQTKYSPIGNSGGTIPHSYTFIGEPYYLATGNTTLISTTDSLYHLNGSLTANSLQLFYDTNFNVTKKITSFDKAKNLLKEERIYYPYNVQPGVDASIDLLKANDIIDMPIAIENWITGDGNPRLIGAALTSYKTLPNGAVRPDKIFAVETNKPVPMSIIGEFNPYIFNRNTAYFKPQSEFVQYNNLGEPIEVKSLKTNISNVVIKGYNQNYEVAKVSNASANDVAFTSFETNTNGNWIINNNVRDINNKITGKKSYSLNNGIISKNNLTINNNYLLSFWKNNSISGNVIINGNTISTSPILTQNGWSLYELFLSGINNISITGSATIDELRLHPKNANMVTSTFEPLVGELSSNDAGNNIIYNEYDNLNRLSLIRDKDLNIVKKMQYSDSSYPISLLPNIVDIGTFCEPNIIGALFTYYKDINSFSTTFGNISYTFLRYQCDCPNVPLNSPEFKIIDGICEKGTYNIASMVNKKVIINKATNQMARRWICTYRYCFSDGSQSVDIDETINILPCTLGCAIY